MKTIIYYTANREQPEFEQQVIDRINKVKGDIPVISVSQKPIDFGTNICVGDRGHTYLNAFRQLLIGCKEATTKYVIMAESDCFYPETGYFDYEPTNDFSIHTYDSVYVVWCKKDWYYPKEQTHGSIIYDRSFLIELLEKSLKGLPEWSRKKIGFPFFAKEQIFKHFSGNPIISVKTGYGVQKGTRINKVPVKEVPYWGTIERFKSEYITASPKEI